MALLALSVLPEPDSPEITIAYFFLFSIIYLKAIAVIVKI
jgi:hypothetical protein